MRRKRTGGSAFKAVRSRRSWAALLTTEKMVGLIHLGVLTPVSKESRLFSRNGDFLRWDGPPVPEALAALRATLGIQPNFVQEELFRLQVEAVVKRVAQVEGHRLVATAASFESMKVRTAAALNDLAQSHAGFFPR